MLPKETITSKADIADADIPEPIAVVYRHPDFIVIDKPIGISVHKDQQLSGLPDWVAQQTGDAKLWLVHRLDKITSGLLILACNSAAAAEFSRLFQTHKIEKHYIALSSGKPKKKQGMVAGDMAKTRNGSWKLCRSQTNPAVTRFHSVLCEPGLRLFHLMPKSGKTHQLRVAMKSLGSPILGDQRYGDKTALDRTYLHAYALKFEYRGEKIAITQLPSSGKYFLRAEVQRQLVRLTIDCTTD
ncbi:TIGR01621 family pseudouridine synthase [Testudinibacter sp. TR-2022]|uniref:TIGR01621 family pseudouridine synthase n=1 Tax=Testudinibacter sp. TR-2022 TaxID=2585029 RepID=UPI001118C986|nr:TIGR01621 family pseudouridine synthase [Testudinibacter sp. TR-2022]TNH03893.1 TIGR01621 family pseudouridine synthase [Pasteurellaceae bacterium Phil11]TNH23120.1 TIGR01621 family pseudouridine synthase [Testudinibacter sp. TR-2022]TNH25432.1 TIGR01621 family pseudouridine synthase [Testudinibacter sp. TR-2022]